MNKILLSIVKKEFYHIRRDPQTLWIVIAMPIVMLFLYSYAITLEMRQIEIVITDQSKTPESRQYIENILSTDFFRLVRFDVPPQDIEQVFKRREAKCALIIPASFARDLKTKLDTKIQLLVDASDPNAANYIQKYLMQVNAGFERQNNRFFVQPFSVEPRIFYNPALKAHNFFVPGLISVIILLISALLTSIAIVREKENGTMEQILVSPVRPAQIIIGKVIPYTLLAFLDGMLVLTIGHLWFRVPIMGSPLLLMGALVIYILTGLSFGLLVSTLTGSQREAMLVTVLATILPTIMLSGFIFPIASMPVLFRYFSWIIPATHFITIIRGVMLKGNVLGDLSVQISALVAITGFMLALSMKKFKTRLE